jgi:hypothetical protein
MPWVVTSWRTDRLEALLGDRAGDIVAAAERDARRVTRVAARERADAAAYLDALERLGEETLAAVRAQRRPRPAAPAQEEIRVLDARPPRRARAGRASLRESPLVELFRATTPTG